MIAIDLNDEHLCEHLESMRILKDCGYSDDEIQKLYERQIRIEKEKRLNAE